MGSVAITGWEMGYPKDVFSHVLLYDNIPMSSMLLRFSSGTHSAGRAV